MAVGDGRQPFAPGTVARRQEGHRRPAQRQQRFPRLAIGTASHLHPDHVPHRRGLHRIPHIPRLLLDATVVGGADEQVVLVRTGQGKQVVNIGLAVSHGDDGEAGRHHLLRGDLGISPALALFGGGGPLPPGVTLADGLRIAGPGLLIEQARGNPLRRRRQHRVQPQPGLRRMGQGTHVL